MLQAHSNSNSISSSVNSRKLGTFQSQWHFHHSWMVNQPRQCQKRFKHHPNSLCVFRNKSPVKTIQNQCFDGEDLLSFITKSFKTVCQMASMNTKTFHLFISQKKTVVLALYVASQDRMDYFVNAIVIFQKNAEGAFH